MVGAQSIQKYPFKGNFIHTVTSIIIKKSWKKKISKRV